MLGMTIKIMIKKRFTIVKAAAVREDIQSVTFDIQYYLPPSDMLRSGNVN